MTRLVTAGWPILTAWNAMLSLVNGEADLVVIDGPQAELDVACMAFNWTDKVTVDSYLDGDFNTHLLVEAA